MPPRKHELSGQPWQRQPEENDRAFGAFVFFRDAGPDRSLIGICNIDTHLTIAVVNRLSSRWNWRERASQWDDYQDQVRLEAHLKELVVMSRRHIRLATKLQTKAMKRLSKIDPDKIPAYAVPAFIKAGIDIERTTRGLHTEHLRTTADNKIDDNYAKLLEDDETRRLLVEAANRQAALEDDSGHDGGTS